MEKLASKRRPNGITPLDLPGRWRNKALFVRQTVSRPASEQAGVFKLHEFFFRSSVPFLWLLLFRAVWFLFGWWLSGFSRCFNRWWKVLETFVRRSPFLVAFSSYSGILLCVFFVILYYVSSQNGGFQNKWKIWTTFKFSNYSLEIFCVSFILFCTLLYFYISGTEAKNLDNVFHVCLHSYI